MVACFVKRIRHPKCAPERPMLVVDGAQFPDAFRPFPMRLGNALAIHARDRRHSACNFRKGHGLRWSGKVHEASRAAQPRAQAEPREWVLQNLGNQARRRGRARVSWRSLCLRRVFATLRSKDLETQRCRPRVFEETAQEDAARFSIAEPHIRKSVMVVHVQPPVQAIDMLQPESHQCVSNCRIVEQLYRHFKLARARPLIADKESKQHRHFER